MIQLVRSRTIATVPASLRGEKRRAREAEAAATLAGSPASYKGDNFPLPAGVSRIDGAAVTGASTNTELELLVDSFAPDPVDINTGHTSKVFLNACQAEQAGLPDPYNENPQPYFRWEADTTNKEVWIRASTPSARHKFIFDSCAEFMGLNREELRRWRWVLAYGYLANLREILRELDHAGVAGSVRQLTVDAMRNMMASDRPYAGMVRYFVNVVWTMGL